MNLSLWIFDLLSVEVFHIFSNGHFFIINMISIVLPTLGYIDQLIKMVQNKSSNNFSIGSSIILILSNVLRFIYWSYEPFVLYLLGQSIAIFTIQIVLIVFNFYYKQIERGKTGFGNRPLKIILRKKFIEHLKITKYNYLMDFIVSLLLYLVLILIMFKIFCYGFSIEKTNSFIIILANIIDTFVSIPRFNKVVVKKDVKGESIVIMYQCLIADILKLIISFFDGSGLAFTFGALLQTIIDTTISVIYNIEKSKRKDLSPTIYEA